MNRPGWRSSRSLVFTGVVVAAVAVIVLLEAFGWEWRFVDAPLHATLEALGGLVAAGLAMFLFQHQSGQDDGHGFLLAVGFLAMGLLDMFHAASAPGNAFVLIRSVASLAGGTGFALVWVPARERRRDAASRTRIAAGVAAGAVVLAVGMMAVGENLAPMTEGVRFRPLPIAINLLAGLLFLASVPRFLTEPTRFGEPAAYVYASMAVLFGLAGLMFPLSHLWDLSWWLWHLLRLVACLLALALVFRTHRAQLTDLKVNLEERKQTEAELNAASRYARSLLEASLDPLVTISPDGKITDVNAATEQVTGLPRAELIGTDFCDYFTEPAKARRGYRQVLQDGLVRDYPLTLRPTNGRTIDVLYNATVYRNETGGLQGVFAAARDITERKQMEDELRRVSRYSRSLLEASLDPLVTISPAGKITDVNVATEQVTGLPRAQLIGTDFSDYFTEPVEARTGYQRVLAEGAVTDYPLTIRHASGRTTDVLYNATVYRNEAGELQGVFAAARDITQRKRAEEQLQRTAEELARSNAELERFAYVASHDLQEPLRMVSSYLELLARRYRGQLDANADEFIAFAVDGAGRMKTLINDLLAYSRVGTRGQPFASTDCGNALGRVLANLAVAIQESGATVTAGPLPTIMADEVQLTQLFQNLIANALKFHGTAPPAIHVAAEHVPGAWEFSVRDNGIGIDPQFNERIFIIFQRLHTTQEYPGTGIGLAICKKIVERHGGRIRVEPAPGGGSIFYFTLPDRPMLEPHQPKDPTP